MRCSIYLVTTGKGNAVKIIAANATIAKKEACKLWGLRTTYFAMVSCVKAVKI